MKRKVILVTDGDICAQKAVELAAQNIGGRCISRSAGNPTILGGSEIVECIKKAKYDPVVVMVDDKGDTKTGAGEMAMEFIINSPEVDVLGVIAVASNTRDVKGVKINYSVDKKGNITRKAVDKNGNKKLDKILKGDTLDILNTEKVPLIIGIGDPGKMEGCDKFEIGAPIITRAMEEILKFRNITE